ncbi:MULTISPECIES: hybrid sensor histidine kinase/response regulator [Rhodopseudomonas]|uniref:histidine kinase n=1 Tax=Rhodopseudomonas palustris TaxID=1076 RepID=A0A0D7EY66_RHOPL|nr:MULTISPECIES: hybrid sensor histidine kinase/response regulator [Rhodopseudomonas]KIZ45571.1 histidine kinase [Rhodopseudomonas palustris]MDF3814023.1 PAS domain-containing protein [Rhodopseudomonas sp. BAL398]WOK16842.1 PAS domain-containing protein [Rhodopseudomonas sp. BAL398]
MAGDFLTGGGEMGALTRAYDWSSNPIGPPQRWPQSLRTALRLLLNSNHPMFIWWGPDLIQFYNDAYRQTMGPERHPGALGQRGRDCWAEIWDVIGPQIEQVMSGGGATWNEDQLVPVTRHGRLEQVYWTYGYSPIDQDDSVGGVLVVCRDVTKEHLAATALREREAELTRVQQIGRIGGLEVDLRDGFRNRRSPEYLLLHGLPPEAAEETHEDWVRRIHPDDRAAAEHQFREAVDGDVREYHAQYRIIRPSDGQTRWISVRSIIERDDQGRAIRLVGAHTDVTEQVVAEQALRQSEEAYRELADQLVQLNATLAQRVQEKTRERDRIWDVSQDLLLVADRNGVWRTVNPAWTKTFGWSEAELLNRTSDWLDHPDDAALTRGQSKALRSGEISVKFESRFRHKDGSYRWLSWVAVSDANAIYAVARDITAEKAAAERLKSAEEALRQSQKMEAVGQLTGGIAHDFNNLLTGIVGSLDLMQVRLDQGRVENIPRYISAAMTSANRATALTHRLLAFARRQPLIPKPVDVNQLVVSLEDLLRRTIGEAIDLHIVAAANLWLTLCDPNQLESAVLNLVINARDAMPEGGRITITTRNVRFTSVNADAPALRPGDYVCVAVADSGAGMSAEVVARAFDPFFTTKPLGQGTGLGLSMIYGFAQQSNGHAEIDSKPGHGTEVRLYLPRQLGAIAAAVERMPAVAASAPSTGGTILVVEDEAVVRGIVVELLRDRGYRVLEACDGPSGLASLRHGERIDLLLTDIGLPGINGRQLADQALELRPALKVLFMTGYAESAAIAKGFLQPGMDMITKPFDLEELARRVRDMVAT